MILLVSKGLAVLSSSSISLVASFVDSALDFLSTLIILGTSLAMGVKSDRHTYPAGKRRFEPLGVLVFSVAMIASFAQVS
jgi:divalent metal cation (Fe/Co/Zn/Cd) transporter